VEQFEAVIESASGGGAYVAVPAAVVEALGGGGRIPVRATFDGVAYAGSIASMGAGPCLGVLKSIRTTLGKQPGQTVLVTVERDISERTVEVPDDFAEALRQAGAREAFDALSFSHRREHVNAINEAKRPDTRQRRIARAVDMITS
jgi:hypothetical protein